MNNVEKVIAVIGLVIIGWFWLTANKLKQNVSIEPNTAPVYRVYNVPPTLTNFGGGYPNVVPDDSTNFMSTPTPDDQCSICSLFNGNRI